MFEGEQMVSKEEIERVLEKAMHPEFDKSLAECGMIKAVEIEQNKAIVTLVVPFLHVPIKEDLIQIIKGSIKEQTGIETEVKIKEMNEKEKEVFGKVVKEVRG